jgi:dUTP pyrophosphatase
MSLELKEGYNGITDLKNMIITRDVFENIEDIPSEFYNMNIYTPINVLVRSVPTIKVRYHKENCPELIEMEKNPIGDFIDLRAAENVELSRGEFKLISLGISVQLPKGYHAEVVPRSSTYKNFGIIMSNSIGIIDESYCGDNDIWMMPVIAMRDTKININDRICQFRVVKNRDINIEVVDKLNNEDRGGIGSTGKN